MRYLPISLVLIALVCIAFGQKLPAGGYDQVVIAANHDPQSCLLHLAAKLNTDHILLLEDIYDPFGDCIVKNLQLVSQFDNSIVGTLEVKLGDESNPLAYNTSLTLDVLKQYNGSACVQIYPGEGDNVYMCRFKYGEALIQLWFKTDEQDTVFRTDWSGLWFPVPYSTVLVPQNYTNVWKASNNPNGNVIGHLGASCGGSNNIQSLNSNAWVTGTIQNSQQTNLGTLLDGYMLYSAVVRPRGAENGTYTSTWVSGYPFKSNQTGTCTDLGFTFGGISNMNDARNGVDVTIFMLQNSSIYTLLTQGLSYSGSLRA